MAQWIGLAIGALVCAAGVYYLAKERADAESKRIYGAIAAVGAVLALACAASMLL
ncbi:MAG: hypothetical protein Q4E13_14435 [Clostridia bacterium]|nr:hypothetical protein [Clostridia bacterium]